MATKESTSKKKANIKATKRGKTFKNNLEKRKYVRNNIARITEAWEFDLPVASEFCARIAQGRSMRTVCMDDDMPSASTIFKWLRDTTNGFNDMYEIAKIESADAMADEILDIADNATNDWMTINGMKVTNREAIERSKLRVNTRQWLMGKQKPKKYGDKLDIDAHVTEVKPILNGITKAHNAIEAEIVEPKESH